MRLACSTLNRFTSALLFTCVTLAACSGGQSGTEALDLETTRESDGEEPGSTDAETTAQTDGAGSGQTDSGETGANETDDTEASETETDAAGPNGSTMETEETEGATETEDSTETDSPETDGVESDGGETDGTETTETDEPELVEETDLSETDTAVEPDLPDTWQLYVDAYRPTCSGYEGQYFCFRVSDDGQEWGLSYSLFWSGYEWGNVYLLRGHFEDEEPGVEDSPPRRYVIDEVVSQEPVEESTRFELRIDPTYESLGLLPQLELLEDGGQIVGGMIADGVAFDCPLETCEWLRVAMAGDEPFDVTFEFDAQQEVTALLLAGEAPSGLPADVTEPLRDAWQEQLPESYVLRVCTGGFLPQSCDVMAVDSGSVVALERSANDAEWEAIELSGDEVDAVEQHFLWLEQGDEYAWLRSFEVDPAFGFVSDVEFFVQSESWSYAIECFEPDTLDTSACMQ